MKNKKRINGFTMAELLIVVAIIAVLGGVGFVAVQNHQRNMALLECDTIAKEIFVAAQNHLSMAESQGYLGSTKYGEPGTMDEDKDSFGKQLVYYYTVNGSGSFSEGMSLLNMMLPFGSIDETVRTGGSYIIRYQPKPARVLDVFYCAKSNSRYSYSLSSDEYQNLLDKRDIYNEDGTIQTNKKNQRKEYGEGGKAVLGWFGNEAVLETGDYNIKEPQISIENKERLIVTVEDINTVKDGIGIKLIVSSKEKHGDEYAKVAFDLTSTEKNHPREISGENGKYVVVLDSVVKETNDISMPDFRFSKLNDVDSRIDKQGSFLPGEDIVVQAVAYRTDNKLSNIAYSAEVTTNSLFAELIEAASDSVGETPSGDGADETLTSLGVSLFADGSSVVDSGVKIDSTPKEMTAAIAYIRHLENLDFTVSSVEDERLNITKAKQIADLNWNSFISDIGIGADNTQIWYSKTSEDDELTLGCYKPVNVDYLSEYDGGYTKTDELNNQLNCFHTVEKINTKYGISAGLFGEFKAPEGKTATISNLELIDFSISSENGNAGALAGALVNTTVQNVLARHEQGSDGTKYKITSTSGNAGGLVGDMTEGRVEQCAAALYVQGQTAGGLLGSANATSDDTPIPLITITASYSGGHTDGTTAHYSETNFNVIATDGSAGGLVGDAKNTTINSCYSTCSAKGKTAAGGLIGSVDNTDTVEYCYATGLVSADTKAHTFLGQGTLKTDNCNYYVSGINGILESGCKATVLPAVLEASDDKNLCKPNKNKPGTEPDSTPKDERAFAVAYDGEIRKQIKAGEPNPRYSYLTIEQICERSKPKDNDGHDIELVTSDFISIHYGDWAEPVALESSLELINAERLTAKVTLPFDEEGEARFGEGQMLTMLIHGDTSKEKMYLTLEVKKDGDKYPVTIREGYIISAGSTEKKAITQFSTYLTNSEEKCTKDASKKELTLAINFDDITAANAHFAELFPGFIPGENIIVSAEGNEVSFEEMKAVVEGDEEKWSEPIEDSDPEKKRILADRTNSLFASFNSEAKAVNIENFRHLENLDGNISALGNNSKTDKAVVIEQVTQTEDLDWDDFKGKVGGSATKKIHIVDMEGVSSKDDCYLPVNPSQYVLAGDSLSLKTTIVSYNGKSSTIPAGETEPVETTHKITGVKIDNAGNAGLFGSMITGSSISNLELIGFDITSTAGNAGTLAGALEAVTVSNIKVSDGNETNVTKVSGSNGNVGGLIGAMKGGSVTNAQVHGEKAVISTAEGHAGGLIGSAESATEVTNTLVYGAEAKVTATNGNAGGLIGNMNGGTVTKSAAVVIVSGRNAGGLIGSVSDSGTITACYAGGHTIDKIVKDEENKDKIVGIEYSNKEDEYNVTAKEGYAGGLIGNAGKARIDRSYSTCSAYGTTAGGFVGTMNGGSVTKCYSTGLVGGTTRGAFAGGFEDSTATDCLYYEIINGPFDDATYPYMTAIGNNHENSGIKPLDTMENYSSFVGVPDLDWKAAEPYNPTLTSFFGKVVEGKTVSRYSLKTVEQLGETVGSGDFVATHYGDWPAPEQLVVNE